MRSKHIPVRFKKGSGIIAVCSEIDTKYMYTAGKMNNFLTLKKPPDDI